MTPTLNGTVAILLAPLHLAGCEVVDSYTCPSTLREILVLDRNHPEGGAVSIAADDAEVVTCRPDQRDDFRACLGIPLRPVDVDFARTMVLELDRGPQCRMEEL